MESTDAPLVVKLGGSLFDRIPQIIQVLKESGRNLLIVPGGGMFADNIRSLDMDDDTAHWMAVCAMEQIGWRIAAEGVHPSERISAPNGTEVLLPYREMRDKDPLPHSWDITSDTIAAWVAKELGTDLLLLKSVEGIRINGRPAEEVTAPVSCDEVDNRFLSYVFENCINAQIINGNDCEKLRAFLTGSDVAGTRIHTRF